MPPNLSSGSLQVSPIPPFSSKFTHPSSQIHNTTQIWLPRGALTKIPMSRIACVSTRPKRKSVSKSEKSEAEELVRLLLRNSSNERPLLSTLNKYVKVVRTEHCFLMFEELGKTDKWIQCLENAGVQMETKTTLVFR
ncbi:hypothetical protein L1049_017411 [Liquidambar formosana]|uniref:Uncharacterized protein n=1 Tax=Liquidambar formosana TaxID=63359 RepID=A0AAP0X870_LIQFO